MITVNLKRNVRVKLLTDERNGPRFVSATALRCAPAMDEDGRFVRLAVLDALDSTNQVWYCGEYPEGFSLYNRGERTWDEHAAWGLANRVPSIIRVALDNIDSIADS